MTLTFRELQTVEDLADLLYEFLPGSGNSKTAFPLAAQQADVAEFWHGGSKRPALVSLLSETLEHRRGKFTALVTAIVRQSMTWRRGKGNPLTREELDRLNILLPGVSFKIPELLEKEFLKSLERKGRDGKRENRNISEDNSPDPKVLSKLNSQLLDLRNFEPHKRGFQFERFLTDLFDAYEMAPRGSFRLVGEQIDGSFTFNNDVYLFEAKWTNSPVGNADLLTFSGKVGRKAQWSRGVFVSYSGFSAEGLIAFERGEQTRIICVDGLDLSEAISGRPPLPQLFERKIRRAAETNSVFVPSKELLDGPT